MVGLVVFRELMLLDRAVGATLVSGSALWAGADRVELDVVGTGMAVATKPVVNGTSAVVLALGGVRRHLGEKRWRQLKRLVSR